MGPNKDTVTNLGSASLISSSSKTNRYSMANITVFSQPSMSGQDSSAVMADIKTFPNLAFQWNGNTGGKDFDELLGDREESAE